MQVKEYELNLSATEFCYFLECPQKFRLNRLLNPVPYKSDFMNSKRTITSYYQRGYSKKLRGLYYHYFFENFHKNYHTMIADDTPPLEIQEDKMKLFYWNYQKKKYLEVKDECYWYPIGTEIRLMTEKQRGIIDCLMLCQDECGLHLIDLKVNPSPIDHLQLLFYVKMINDYREEYPEDERFDYNVEKISCYYYETSEEKFFESSKEKLEVFDMYLNDIRNKILNTSLNFERTSCWNCDLIRVCNIERRYILDKI